jgi:hypothetical protein
MAGGFHLSSIVKDEAEVQKQSGPGRALAGATTTRACSQAPPFFKPGYIGHIVQN